MTSLLTIRTEKSAADPDLLLHLAKIRVESAHFSAAAALPSQPEALPHASEEYRIARTRIAQLLPVPFRLAITSPSIGDGKTLSSVNLAAVMASTGDQMTLLVDADLRSGAVSTRLQTPAKPGLSELLRGECEMHDAIYQTQQLPGLYVLPAGESGGNSSELLHTNRWNTIATALSAYFPQVLVDCPPVDLFADCDLITNVCDAVLLVARPDHTERKLLAAALERLAPKLLGVLINAVPDSFLHASSKQRYRDYYKRAGGSLS